MQLPQQAGQLGRRWQGAAVGVVVAPEGDHAVVYLDGLVDVEWNGSREAGRTKPARDLDSSVGLVLALEWAHASDGTGTGQVVDGVDVVAQERGAGGV